MNPEPDAFHKRVCHDRFAPWRGGRAAFGRHFSRLAAANQAAVPEKGFSG
jgi:hypothetical protein